MKPNFHSIKYPSLGTQLLGLGGGIVLLLALAFTWFNTQTQREELQDVFTKQARALAFNLAVSSSSHLLERDFSVIENLLLKTDGFEDLHSGTVLDPTGHILAQVIRDQESRRLKAHYNSQTMMLGTSPSISFKKSQNGKVKYLLVSEPVDSGGVIGMVALEFDLSSLQASQTELIQRNILLAIALIVPATFASWLFIRKVILELNSLTDFAQLMVNDEGISHKVSPSSRELAMLHITLNWASGALARKNRALEEARVKADKSNDLKSQFVANMSHEIRTPLNGILGLTEITLGTTTLGDKPRRNLELIQLSADHLLRVVNDILDFSKIDANKLDIDPIPFALRANVQAMIKTVSSAYSKPNVTLVLEIAPEVPDHLHGDCARILQVLNNLLSNALKFTQQGVVTLNITLEESRGPTQPSDTAHVHFSVRDSGMGISDAARSEIFKAFSQAEPGTARKYGGTGLGLTISQRLLELMNSGIDLWSEEGVGSEFSFTLALPVAHAPSPVNNDVAHNNMESVQFKDLSTPGMGQACDTLRILVAEDNMVNQAFISHVLTQLGISYRFADDGLAAVKAVEEETFDLVFMDMHMPNMGGLEACRTILTQPKHHKLPIVGLTADAIADTREACMAAGMKEYISKPFKRSDIENVLTRLNFKISPIPMQNFDHDRELLKTTMEMIVAEIPNLLEEIELRLQQAQWLDAKRALHTLKGHCKLIGEMDFASFLQGLENQLANSQSPAEQELSHLRVNIKALQHRLRMLSQ
ncbi:MAG: response regulator [Limnobacter sp.]|uniref:response regulator n=1 Tax=Limnobacter sp. TaxID=2003368 RepID=UPI0022BACC4E|nr:response regulator [Limnobacter sp.]MCZ8016710.1 response regulator [Limnobacter sp.]